MGLFDFVKEAGQALGVGEEGKKAAPAGGALRTVDQAAIDRRRAAALKHLVETNGLHVTDLAVQVAGDMAVVSGKVESQADREKVILLVGNTFGIARVDDRMEVVLHEPTAAFYTVKAGDTLSKIAKAHYGDARKYPAIFEANRPMLSDPNTIYPGQVLRLPPLST